jgi:hypothetical protein
VDERRRGLSHGGAVRWGDVWPGWCPPAWLAWCRGGAWEEVDGPEAEGGPEAQGGEPGGGLCGSLTAPPRALQPPAGPPSPPPPPPPPPSRGEAEAEAEAPGPTAAAPAGPAAAAATGPATAAAAGPTTAGEAPLCQEKRLDSDLHTRGGGGGATGGLGWGDEVTTRHKTRGPERKGRLVPTQGGGGAAGEVGWRDEGGDGGGRRQNPAPWPPCPHPQVQPPGPDSTARRSAQPSSGRTSQADPAGRGLWHSPPLTPYPHPLTPHPQPHPLTHPIPPELTGNGSTWAAPQWRGGGVSPLDRLPPLTSRPRTSSILFLYRNYIRTSAAGAASAGRGP